MTKRDHLDVGAYYDQEPVAMAEATGAGLIWFMGRDHLSPPLSNADEFALDSSRWREAVALEWLIWRSAWVSIQVIESWRLVVASVDLVETSLKRQAQMWLGLVSALSSCRTCVVFLRRIRLAFYGCDYGRYAAGAIRDESLDHVYSINAIYHVNDHTAVIAESHRVLKPSGRFAVDDWFVTDQTRDTQLAQLRHNWSTGSNGFHNFNQFHRKIQDTGFNVLEVKDFTEEAGAFLTEERFGTTYDTQIAPVLLNAFPQLYQYDGYDPAHAEMAVAQLRADILYMGELYRGGDAVYRQVIAEK